MINHSPTARIAEIEARAKAATEGPWIADKGKVYGNDGPVVGSTGAVVWLGMRGYQPEQNVHNAEFAAHAREDIPWLLSELKAAREEIERLKSIANITSRIELIDSLEAERDRNTRKLADLGVELSRLRAVVEAARGVDGLLKLLELRGDLPETAQDAVVNNHRIVELRRSIAVLDSAEGETT